MSVATTSELDELLAKLDETLNLARRRRGRFGYFAALLRRLVLAVQKGIEEGTFEDADRTARFVCASAERFLEALEGEKTSRCWEAAFEAARSVIPIVPQHLMLGVNAFIHHDFPIAAVQVAPGESLPTLKNDFMKVADILAQLIEEAMDRIGLLSPYLGVLDQVGGRTEEGLFGLSLGAARERAWSTAERLASITEETERNVLLGDLDREFEAAGRKIAHPGLFIGLGSLIIRTAEEKSVPAVIEALAKD